MCCRSTLALKCTKSNSCTIIGCRWIATIISLFWRTYRSGALVKWSLIARWRIRIQYWPKVLMLIWSVNMWYVLYFWARNCHDVEFLTASVSYICWLCPLQSYFILNTDGYTIDLTPLTAMRANITTIRLINPSNVDVLNTVYEFHMQNRFRSMNANQVTVSVDYLFSSVFLFLYLWLKLELKSRFLLLIRRNKRWFKTPYPYLLKHSATM